MSPRCCCVERFKTVVYAACSPWVMPDPTFPECLRLERHGAEGSFFNFLESEQKLSNQAVDDREMMLMAANPDVKTRINSG